VSAEPEPVPATPTLSACPLCGTPVAPASMRCEACGMTLAGTGDRPGPFLRRTLWVWAGALLAIYLVVLLVVATVHD
jgi:predicted nucleic acid-binding Zn ribbon protein